MAVRVIDDGRLNPRIVVPPDELATWLRKQADEQGYGGRELVAVQIQVEQPFAEGASFHNELPTLVVMVSNASAPGGE